MGIWNVSDRVANRYTSIQGCRKPQYGVIRRIENRLIGSRVGLDVLFIV